jgi:hypothetical protein
MGDVVKKAAKAAIAFVTFKAAHKFKATKATTALLVKAATVVNAFDAKEADAEKAERMNLLMRGVADVRRKIEAFYEDQKRPINKLRAQVLEFERVDLGLVTPLETSMKTAHATWYRIAQAKAAQKAIADQAIVDKALADQRAAQVETLTRVAEAEPDAAVAAAIQTEAASLAAAPLPRHHVEPVKVPTFGTPVVETYEPSVVDLKAFVDAISSSNGGVIPYEAVTPSATWLKTWATQTKGGATLPGVTVKIGDSTRAKSLA